MKSLSRIVKEPTEEHKVRPYDFFSGFTKAGIKKQEHWEEEEPEEEEEEDLADDASSSEIIEKARHKAEQILNDARKQAEILREKAYAEGMEEGRMAGYRQAHEEQRLLLDEEINSMKRNIKDLIESVTIEKTKIIESSIDNLKDISLAVAEKIIKTSLQSSGDIVKRMILAATDKMTKRQWAKIYVTKSNTAMSLEVDTEFLDALSHLSDNIKILTMDDGEEGTCIIELPNEIIDSSVGTQLENIKDIINNAKM